MKYKILSKRSKGFTLVELLVVIAIIGILSTLLLLQLNVARSKARDTKRIADITNLRTAVEQYYDDNGAKYPTSPLTFADLSRYLTGSTLPVDPLSGNAYYYAVDATRTHYDLYTELEQNNPGLKGDDDINASGWNGDANDNSLASTETCNPSNYTATSKQCVYDVGQK